MCLVFLVCLLYIFNFYPVYTRLNSTIAFMTSHVNFSGNNISQKRQKINILSSNSDSTIESVNNESTNNIKTIGKPKTKYGLCLGYIGTGYYGFQKQIVQGDVIEETVETIEGTIEKALIASNAIDTEFKHKLYKLEWSKAARTDKGVHAACMVVGCRLKNIGDDFLKIFNDNLPESIICYDVFRVTKGFDARSLCSYRCYEYIFPGYLLSKFNIPSDHLKFYESCCDMVDKCSKCPKSSCYNRPQDNILIPEKIPCKPDNSYKVTDGDIALLEEIFSDFIGSHNFHNFSSRVNPLNPACFRYINSIKVSRVECVDNFVRVSIQGHSFLFNQIRKMVAVAIEVFRGSAPRNTIKYCLNRLHSANVNTAPAQGLFLHHPNFDVYNLHRASPPQTKHILFDDIKKPVIEFISQSIYPEILKYDKWEEWLGTINEYPFYWENPTHKLVTISTNGTKYDNTNSIDEVS